MRAGPARRPAPGAAAGTAALAAGGALAVLRARPPGGAARWERTNHAGTPVTLLEGPAAVVGLLAGGCLLPGPARLRLAAGVAVAGAGAAGLLDDLAGRGPAKGLRGHLDALRRGQLTTGVVKIAALAGTGAASAALASGAGPARGGPGAWVDRLVGAALVAGTANLVNLLDLRPGRALKAGLLAGGALAAGPGALGAGVAGTSLALLPVDLSGAAMLGDTGANAVGAVLGLAVHRGAPRPVRVAALALLVALTLASERVSFTSVIESTPVLRELDALGRR